MKPKVFLEFVEIKSLIASVLPFVLGSLYAIYNYHQVHLGYLGLFFIASSLFHMATNANDNYQDFLHAPRDDNNQEFLEETNVVGVNQISIGQARTITFGLAGISLILGLWLVTRTGLPLLWMGLYSYAVGYFYAGGPKPISTGPFGEFFSGFTMGFMIFWISVYLNTYDVAPITWIATGQVLVASGLAIFAIANIMLANNICDMDEDIALGRHTILYYLGKPVMLQVFAWSYVAGYLCLIAAVALRVLPPLSLLTLISAIPVYRNTKQFLRKQVKRETFILSIKNATIICLSFAVFMGLGLLIG
ncbi:1,4-dihydroxy-2-naphthoate polyprenyltransferase [Lactiplantibacillus mudanjiangensis]|uniref:Prenyltransferase [Lactobacillus plantarum JDM1] n=1 Tax=Lactiplantibacillus mudanjiangensis TaxID=1296538 RepID=A0A660E497_9LACO|nr:1,4-dihydroxy-2-naphthoate polyprenyltransferase [Lactiplantibacillus mudanjiangensis]VDG17634.1 prenyltransferase [Lactobacillus plantarum JDM1] [Lactiplantibacillus mudanjiangensis]VDG23091.1 prenyltransferase [Lactobacillus plantarum JDM1] [Lactiplantibacillus mudanjiangensis]VDG29563.1 prenyltransferase [Lactobacillus plantarum JDM1] [Lactiplantibacillus mudanjiangensis]VDG32676.1 prenyltransferase [Lactobacillus plantarum JDM1] [Lactiplantibacillus mudanjiangensis]